MSDWFTIDTIDNETFILSEYRHWEETHCYLLCGTDRALLIDTGLGICDISREVEKLTSLPVTAAATHVHWDHLGGHQYYPDFFAHEAELDWLNGKFPLSRETVREMVLDRCDPPVDFDIERYEMFQGTPTRVLRERGYLFTGDLVYKDVLFAYYPSTDPEAYLASMERVAALPVKRVFPAHHSLGAQPELLARIRDAFRDLKAEGKLHHGGGQFDYGDFGIWI